MEGSPPGRAWDLGYWEWAPPHALRACVACVWAQVAPPAGGPATLVLPDACADLIWQSGRGVFLAGPDTGPAPASLPAGTVLAGVRLRPGAGGPVLGLPMSAVLDQRVDLADLGPGAAARLGRRVPGTLAPQDALRLLVDGVGALAGQRPEDRLATGAARLLARPRVQVDEVAASLGVSERQLLRRCREAVGYGPATLRRVLRFRRFVSRLDAGHSTAGHSTAGHGDAGLDLARLAAETGYADQAHLSRECARLAGLPPAALAAQRQPLP
ncbi:MAG TPA: DUF6597 domain-containing transcriptional factor [Streptosporangiaceae bacterium]|nr:DUF6597 domain-containing transcriptional factor [Streptosporangiaceae bacterium]